MGGRGASSGKKYIIDWQGHRQKINDLLITNNVLFRAGIDAGEKLNPYYYLGDLDMAKDPKAFKILKETKTHLTIQFKVEAIHKPSVNLPLTLTRTVPKRYVYSSKAWHAEHQRRLDARTAAWREKYDKAFAFAKANKIKGIRKGMRTADLLEKIKGAGINYKW